MNITCTSINPMVIPSTFKCGKIPVIFPLLSSCWQSWSSKKTSLYTVAVKVTDHICILFSHMKTSPLGIYLYRWNSRTHCLRISIIAVSHKQPLH
jgi:hypothetical protein